MVAQRLKCLPAMLETEKMGKRQKRRKRERWESGGGEMYWGRKLWIIIANINYMKA